jgi:GNAT superfamily N-acetyltransferase
MAPLQIAGLLKCEIDSARELLAKSFGEPSRQTARIDVEATFADYPYAPISLVGHLNEKIVSFIQICPAYFHPNTYCLAWLGVDQAVRRRGYGKLMMEAAEKLVLMTLLRDKPGTIVLVAASAPHYYEKLGFKRGPSTFDGAPIMLKNLEQGWLHG